MSEPWHLTIDITDTGITVSDGVKTHPVTADISSVRTALTNPSVTVSDGTTIQSEEYLTKAAWTCLNLCNRPGPPASATVNAPGLHSAIDRLSLYSALAAFSVDPETVTVTESIRTDTAFTAPLKKPKYRYLARSPYADEPEAPASTSASTDPAEQSQGQSSKAKRMVYLTIFLIGLVAAISSIVYIANQDTGSAVADGESTFTPGTLVPVEEVTTESSVERSEQVDYWLDRLWSEQWPDTSVSVCLVDYSVGQAPVSPFSPFSDAYPQFTCAIDDGPPTMKSALPGSTANVTVIRDEPEKLVLHSDRLLTNESRLPGTISPALSQRTFGPGVAQSLSFIYHLQDDQVTIYEILNATPEQTDEFAHSVGTTE